MTVNPITLDLRDFNRATSSNIVNMQPIDCINVNVSVMDICAWIISRGGWANISIYDIMTLIRAYLGITNLGFMVTTSHITGCILYYLDNRPSGNSLTGCLFTT